MDGQTVTLFAKSECTSCHRQVQINNKTLLKKVLQFLTVAGMPANTSGPLLWSKNYCLVLLDKISV